MAYKYIPVKLRNLSFTLLFLLFSISHSFSQNAIVTENLLPGSPRSVWDESDQGSIQGFPTEFSVNKGSRINFKIDIDANINLLYSVEIFRIGYYQGNGARFITNIFDDLGNPLFGKRQPDYLYENSTGKVDCSNWTESCHWDVPANAVSGIYVARLDCGGVGSTALIIFMVRDDNANSEILFKTSDATWQAYNGYGGNTFYTALTPVPGSSHATKLSYQRPFTLRGNKSYFFNNEFPMLMWLERNGYDVTYASDMDMARDPTVFTPAKHKVLLSVGHSEYWSAEQYDKFETARNNGVNLAFFSGNTLYWKTRWENNYQTLVCYKEGTQGTFSCGSKCDPLPNVWTGLWRDGCSPPYSPNDGCKPEGGLVGQMGWIESSGSIEIPYTYKNYRIWKNTSVASLGVGQKVTLPFGTLGQEWDPESFTDTYPARRNALSFTSLSGLVHKMSMYKANSGALVFSSGSLQWSWGLDINHDYLPFPLNPPSLDMQQATYNILYDMNSFPASKQANIVTASPSADFLAPTTIITSPLHTASVPGSFITISGTSSDNGGGVLAGVEISIDNGATWNNTTGTTNWSYTFHQTDFSPITIKVRGWDDVFNVEVPGVLGSANCIIIYPTGPFENSLFEEDYPTVLPPFTNLGNPIELGTKFKSTSDGLISGLRYYKHPSGSGIITGHIWSSTGTLLATKIFTNETASGWQTATLDVPLPILANTTYIVSYFSPLGKFVVENPFFTQAFINGNLRGLANGEDGRNGVFNFGASGFPTEGWLAAGSGNFYADVFFTSTDFTAPQVVTTSPLNNATFVSLNVAPTATFNENLTSGSVNSTTVILTGPGNTIIPGIPSVNGAVVTFTPTNSLTPNTIYTLTLKGGITEPVIKDISGNKLAADFIWSFTTEFNIPPLVSVQPVSQTTCPNSTISFTSACNGYPVPTVQWEVSTDNGNSWNNIFGQTNPTYTFTANLIDNNNQYRAVWTNNNGFANSNPAILTITPSITGTIAAVFPNICPGSPLQLQLTSATGTGPFSLQINSSTYTNINVGQPFTPLGNVNETIFSASYLPQTLNQPDANAIEVGVKFRANKSGVIKGIRFFKGSNLNGGIHTGSLWSQSGTLLATATFVNETASGWQEVLFASPVAINLNTTYVASYFLPQGRYSKTENYFTDSAHSNYNSLAALQFTVGEPNGVYKNTSQSSFPNLFLGEPNYWVDVIFAAYATTTTTFNLTSITSSNGCTFTSNPISSTTITVSPTQNAGVISGSSPLCIGSTATFTSNGDLGGTWSSSNSLIATVNPSTGLVTAVGPGNVNITYTIIGCTATVSTFQVLTVNSCGGTIVNLKLFLQGYYAGAGQMQPVLFNQGVGVSSTETDTITVELRDSNTPYGIVASKKGVLNTDGTISISFAPITGSFYIAILHRNTIQTWSTNPVSVGAVPVLYDFTTEAAKAFGNNMKQEGAGPGAIWVLYTGDLNQDEFIDPFDFGDFDIDSQNGVNGVYVATDFNGDGFVDPFDFQVFDENSQNGIGSQHP